MIIAISIPLADLIIAPEQDIDLTAMPEQEAAELIRQAFSFLSPTLNVSVSNGIATITAMDVAPEQRDEAQRLYSQGLKSAQQGKYRQAIRYFEEALELAPDHADARRNMGMAYLELGMQNRPKPASPRRSVWIRTMPGATCCWGISPGNKSATTISRFAIFRRRTKTSRMTSICSIITARSWPSISSMLKPRTFCGAR